MTSLNFDRLADNITLLLKSRSVRSQSTSVFWTLNTLVPLIELKLNKITFAVSFVSSLAG